MAGPAVTGPAADRRRARTVTFTQSSRFSLRASSHLPARLLSMKLHHQLLTIAVAAALYVPAAHAEVAIDVIGGSEITFEGLVQADGNWYDNDVVDLNGGDAGNGKNSEFELRRAELVLKGKGPGNVEWVVGYDAKADKFLDTNVKYKLLGNANHFIQVGQFKQPNSL